mmetsp:Transcript_13536/g.29723  ORF Transcript_13536/g.29723 Transcript_13536/m.29723 type:complete len:734 (-) Transcript_13536:65-2266(-)
MRLPSANEGLSSLVEEGGSSPSALVSACSGQSRALAARASSPGTGRRRPDSAWAALEERVSSQVAALLQRHGDEQVNSDRLVRATTTRLESRVRVLEGQGVRADRRAAELSGLAQALTEQQQALLVRLDRLEEQLRGCRRPLGEDCLRHMSRLEREQRADALNLRLLAGATEEAQDLQTERLRRLEEKVDVRMRPLEERLRLAAPSSWTDAADRATRSGRAVRTENSQTSDLHVAEEAPTYWASYEEGRRAAVFDKGRGDGCRRFALTGAQAPPSEERRQPSVETVEARVWALQADMEDLQRRVGGHPGQLESQIREVLKEFRKEDSALQAAQASQLGRRLDEHALRMAEIATRISQLPSHEHIAAFKEALRVQASQIDELRGSLQAIESMPKLGDGSAEVASSRPDLHIELLELRALRDRFEPAAALQGTVCSLQDRLRSQAEELAELRSKLEVIAELSGEGSSAMKKLQHRLDDTRATLDATRCHTERLELQLPTEKRMQAQLDDLAKRLRSSADTASQVEEVRAELGQRVQANAAAISELRLLFGKKMLEHPEQQDASRSGDCSKASDVAAIGPGITEQADAGAEGYLAALSEELQQLRAWCEGLQEAVEQRSQETAPSAEWESADHVQKVELLLSENAERFSRIEEQEMRLELALTKLSAQEQKVQSCMDRVEKQPGPSQIRGLCREEVRRELEDFDVDALRRRVDQQSTTIRTVQERLEAMQDGGSCR